MLKNMFWYIPTLIRCSTLFNSTLELNEKLEPVKLETTLTTTKHPKNREDDYSHTNCRQSLIPAGPLRCSRVSLVWFSHFQIRCSGFGFWGVGVLGFWGFRHSNSNSEMSIYKRMSLQTIFNASFIY